MGLLSQLPLTEMASLGLLIVVLLTMGSLIPLHPLAYRPNIMATIDVTNPTASLIRAAMADVNISTYDTVRIVTGGTPYDIDLGDTPLTIDGAAGNAKYGCKLTSDDDGSPMPDLLGPGPTGILQRVKTRKLTLRGRIVIGSFGGGNTANSSGQPTIVEKLWLRPRTQWVCDWVNNGQTWSDVLPRDGVSLALFYPDLFTLLQCSAHLGDLIVRDINIGWGHPADQAQLIDGYKYPDFDSATKWTTHDPNPDSGRLWPRYLALPGTGSGDYLATTNQDGDGWGDATLRNQRVANTYGAANLCYNRIGVGPRLTSFGNIPAGSHFKFERNYFHDALGRGALLGGRAAAGATVEIYDNTFDRIVGDHIQFGGNDVGTSQEMVAKGNLFIRPAQGSKADQGPNRAHQDCIQDHYVNVGASKPVFLREFDSNVLICTPYTRAAPQFLFVNVAGICYSVGTKTRNNMAIGCAPQGIWDQPGRDPYVVDNMCVNPSWVGSLAEAGATQTAVTLQAGVKTANDIGYFPNAKSIYGGGLITGNLFEAFDVAATPNVASNATVARDSGSETAVFLGATGAAPTTLREAFTWAKRTPAFAAYGPQGATLEDVLDSYKTISSEPVSARPAAISGADLSQSGTGSTALSKPIAIVGKLGQTIPISLPAGVRVKLLTPAQALAGKFVEVPASVGGTAYPGNFGTPASVVGGQFIQYQFDTAANPLTTTNYDISLDGQSFRVPVTTKSTNDFPAARKTAAAQYWRRTPSGTLQRNGVNLADNKEAIIWLDFIVHSAPAAATFYDLVQGVSGRTFRSSIGTNGTNTAFTVYLSPANSGGSTIGQAQFANLQFGKRYRIGVSVDTSQATAALAVIGGGRNVTDNTDLGAPTLTYTKDALVVWSHAHTAGYPRILSGCDSTLYCAIFDNRSMQQLGLTPKTNWDYTVDELGTGEGLLGVPNPDGIALKPLLFMPGETTPNNRGQGGTWGIDSGTLTDVNSKTFPPALIYTAEVLTLGPYLVGSPLEILLAPLGINSLMTVTSSSDKAGTWTGGASQSFPVGSNGKIFTFIPSESGTHHLSFVNDVDYVNPDSLSIEVLTMSTHDVTVSSTNLADVGEDKVFTFQLLS